MRTTVDIPDPIYQRLKQKAARQGTTVKQLVLSSVEKDLAAPAPRRYTLKLPLIKSKQPGTLHLTNEMINDILFP